MSETTKSSPGLASQRYTENAGLVRKFVTPEGIDLRLQLADAGERAAAFCIDIVIMLTAVLIFAIIIAVLGSWAVAGEATIILLILVFFALRGFYFTFFEIGTRAATPGKRLIGIRVAPRAGGRLSAESVFARNAMRELEVFLPLSFLFAGGDSIDGWIGLAGFIWAGIFAFFPFFNKDRLRPGDIVGGTWVLKAPKRALMTDLAKSGESLLGQWNFSMSELDVYGIHELNLLEDILRRRDKATMEKIAERIRTKIKRAAVQGEDDAAFLQAYYTALRQRLETRMLYGVRRKDKTDLR